MVPGDIDAIPPALPVCTIHNVLAVKGSGNNRSLEVVHDITAHQPCRHSREKAIGNKREEVASCQDWVGGLIERGMRLIADLIDQILVFFSQACRHTLGEDWTRLVLGEREEGRDEKTLFVEEEDDFKFLHEREEFVDVRVLEDLCEILHQHET